MQPVVLIAPPAGVATIPLVCDSPHSGTHYPADFGHAIARAALRKSEDTHVDALWADVPAVGGTLLCATFPRSYIDTNRDEADVDVTMLSGPWPHDVRLSPRTATLGIGLVWRATPEHRPIYERLLTPEEVRNRIERYWRPYRELLGQQIEAAAARHGAVWHLNLHSMPSNAYERLGLAGGRPLADVVLGDRHGASCEPGFVAVVRRALEAQGLSVAVNDPYEGADLVRAHGDPARGRHSLQIEVNRALYMDEATREQNAGFAPLRRALADVTRAVADHVAAQVAAPQAG